MLRPWAFATSLAALSGASHVLFHLFRLLAPIGFKVLFNAQFMGADVASLFDRDVPLGNFLVSFVLLVLTAWIFGYAWAWLYNRLAK